MDSNKEMYIIVAEKEENSSEMLLNVYDLNGHGESYVKIETDLEIKQEDEEQENENGMLHEDNATNNDPVQIKQELEEAELDMELDIIKKEFITYSNTAIDKEYLPTPTMDSIECYNEIENCVRHEFEDIDSLVQYQEEQLANSYWLKFRKILREEGIIVENKKELPTVINTQYLKKLCNPGNDKGDRIVKKIVRLMKQQVPSPDINTVTYFRNEDGYFQCLFCSSEELSEILIQEHYTMTHGPRYLFCLACDSAYGTKSYLWKHESQCTSTLVPLVRAARKLERQKAGPFPRSFNLVCHVCGKMFRRNNMDIHLRSHATQNMFFCSLCTASFRSPESCEAHERAHNGLRPYKCTQCPRAYTSRTSLQTHKETHLALGFTCDVCKRCFKRKYTLILHMGTHMVPLFYFCWMTPPPTKRAKYHPSLWNTDLTPEAPEFYHDFDLDSDDEDIDVFWQCSQGKNHHVCKQCGKTLSSRVSYRNHMKKHTGGSALHNCTKCNKRYPAIYTLRAHMKKKHGTTIVTRKMFFNILPTMGTELDQKRLFDKTSEYIEVKKTENILRDSLENEENTCEYII